jgi:hypothetical protein
MSLIDSNLDRAANELESEDSDLNRKFWIAIVLFAVLALLAWFTIGDGSVMVMGKPVEIRLVPLIVIGGLTLKTILARQAEKIRRQGEKDS